MSFVHLDSDVGKSCKQLAVIIAVLTVGLCESVDHPGFAEDTEFHGETKLTKTQSIDDVPTNPHAMLSRIRHETASGLVAFKQQENNTLSLFAAWEATRRSCRTITHMINGRVARRVEPDPNELQRFIGFLSGRLRAEPPRAWKALVSAARAGECSSSFCITFPRMGGPEDEARFVCDGILPFWLVRHVEFDCTCSENVDSITVGEASVEFTLTSCHKVMVDRDIFNRIEMKGGAVGHVCVLEAGECVYVSVSDRLGRSTKVGKARADDGRFIWIVDSFSVEETANRASSGIAFHFEEMALGGTHLCVFGASEHGMTIEVLSCEKGKSLAWFDSSSIEDNE